MGTISDPAMKRTQFLSVVLSLIMFTGVTAGNVVAVYADSDDLEEQLEDFCELTTNEQFDLISENEDIAQYEEELGEICDISDEDQREDALDELIDKIVPETKDSEVEDYEDDDSYYDRDNDERDHDSDDREDDYYHTSDKRHEDNDKNKHDDYLEDTLEDFCELSDKEKDEFFTEHERLAEFEDRIQNHCDLDKDQRDDVVEELVEELEEEYEMKHAQDMASMLENYCEMSEDDRTAFLSENDKAAEHEEKMNRYCDLDDQGKEDFIDEHLDEYISHIKHEKMTKMSDHKKDHMMKKDEMSKTHNNGNVYDHQQHKYEKYCEMSGAERAESINSLEKLERISAWCEMTPEEREEYEMTRHDSYGDDQNSTHDKKKIMMDKQNMSPRLKEMIMTKYDISDEKLEQIKIKYQEKYGEMSDEKKSEIAMKYKNYVSSHVQKMSDEHKAAIHERLAEMKAFKQELRNMDSDLTDEQKQELREEFIQKAKELHLAWISPRVQVTAGLDVADIQCREGYTLVLKESNGMPMCITGDSALSMIDKGIAVLPAV